MTIAEHNQTTFYYKCLKIRNQNSELEAILIMNIISLFCVLQLSNKFLTLSLAIDQVLDISCSIGNELISVTTTTLHKGIKYVYKPQKGNHAFSIIRDGKYTVSINEKFKAAFVIVYKYNKTRLLMVPKSKNSYGLKKGNAYLYFEFIEDRFQPISLRTFMFLKHQFEKYTTILDILKKNVFIDKKVRKNSTVRYKPSDTNVFVVRVKEGNLKIWPKAEQKGGIFISGEYSNKKDKSEFKVTYEDVDKKKKTSYHMFNGKEWIETDKWEASRSSFSTGLMSYLSWKNRPANSRFNGGSKSTRLQDNAEYKGLNELESDKPPKLTTGHSSYPIKDDDIDDDLLILKDVNTGSSSSYHPSSSDKIKESTTNNIITETNGKKNHKRQYGKSITTVKGGKGPYKSNLEVKSSKVLEELNPNRRSSPLGKNNSSDSSQVLPPPPPPPTSNSMKTTSTLPINKGSKGDTNEELMETLMKELREFHKRKGLLGQGKNNSSDSSQVLPPPPPPPTSNSMKTTSTLPINKGSKGDTNEELMETLMKELREFHKRKGLLGQGKNNSSDSSQVLPPPPPPPTSNSMKTTSTLPINKGSKGDTNEELMETLMKELREFHKRKGLLGQGKNNSSDSSQVLPPPPPPPTSNSMKTTSTLPINKGSKGDTNEELMETLMKELREFHKRKGLLGQGKNNSSDSSQVLPPPPPPPTSNSMKTTSTLPINKGSKGDTNEELMETLMKELREFHERKILCPP
ncbi:hypothetical protein BdWA1_003174 [Babesia duncani]|uniref:WH2 domain-containing protein n=1 Tax=Babesia duncani TaxID=323732 RepID=A0AAD9PIM5_9APIC|nr:hypothetical protein BdWA1_003174 [Babesia duncani]